VSDGYPPMEYQILQMIDRMEDMHLHIKELDKVLTFTCALLLYTTSPGNFIKPERQKAVREWVKQWLHGTKRNKSVSRYIKSVVEDDD
jgi:hypothetical protein